MTEDRLVVFSFLLLNLGIVRVGVVMKQAR